MSEERKPPFFDGVAVVDGVVTPASPSFDGAPSVALAGSVVWNNAPVGVPANPGPVWNVEIGEEVT